MWLREMENTGYLKVGIDLYKILRYWSFFQINWFKIDLIPFFADQGESSSVVEGDILTLSPMAGGSQDTMVGLSQSSTATPHSHRDRSPSPRQLFDREPGRGPAGVQDNIVDEVNSEYDPEISKVILRLDSSG